MSKKIDHSRIILSYSIILVGSLFLIGFSIATLLIASDKLGKLNQISRIETHLNDINRAIYEMDVMMKDYIHDRDFAIKEKLWAKQQEIITKMSPLKSDLIKDSERSIAFVRDKESALRKDIAGFLFWILIISVIVVVFLFITIIAFMITAINGLFISKQSKNRMMLFDNETGLYNKNYLYETLTNYKNLSDRYQTEIGLVGVGIEQFNELVAKYGKKSGSLIMKSVAKMIQSTCRNYDFTARYNGSEFFILTLENSPENLKLMAIRLKEQIESLSIDLNRKEHCHIQVSLAIGGYREVSTCYGDVQVPELIQIVLERMRKKIGHGGGIEYFQCDQSV